MDALSVISHAIECKISSSFPGKLRKWLWFKEQVYGCHMRRAYGLKPRAEAYCYLVDILGCGKLVEKAIRVVNQMSLEECDGAVLGDLHGACKLYLSE
ncbi:hypothetical protein RND71_042165 [Anisodus tanguticus]|uniref:Pentatricopeptide repeat-containing protein n=1 Tax=Anisodus tanguticus TaxID=243964 RepID=A0AAE1QQF0_9SOLA|nr:hypothetical protein RND71_042165 [Anisodus tanguticus]